MDKKRKELNKTQVGKYKECFPTYAHKAKYTKLNYCNFNLLYLQIENKVLIK